MVSFRVSPFLPAALGAASMVSRPVGRGIDDMEREDISTIGPSGPAEDDFSPMPGAARLSAARERTGVLEGEPLDIFSNTILTRDPVALSEVEDRRKFHPVPHADSLTVRGSKTRLDAWSDPQSAHLVKYRVSRNVITCVRRRIRREVLLATGKGGANRYKPPLSEEVCE